MGLAFSTAAAAIFLGILSTAALSLLNGQPVVGGSVHTANSIANAIGNGLTVALWEHLTWSVIFALAGLLLALTVLWLRVIAPRD
jgi:predicted MFS family arabinose efflux permease